MASLDDMKRWGRKILVFPFVVLIKFYQLCISPLKPHTCRFTPTCSHYALEAFRKYGPLKNRQFGDFPATIGNSFTNTSALKIDGIKCTEKPAISSTAAVFVPTAAI